MIALKVLCGIAFIIFVHFSFNYKREHLSMGWLFATILFCSFYMGGDPQLLIASGLFGVAGSVTNLKRR